MVVQEHASEGGQRSRMRKRRVRLHVVVQERVVDAKIAKEIRS